VFMYIVCLGFVRLYRKQGHCPVNYVCVYVYVYYDVYAVVYVYVYVYVTCVCICICICMMYMYMYHLVMRCHVHQTRQDVSVQHEDIISINQILCMYIDWLALWPEMI
jgi:hypothetical protein